jgi:glycosyltransferase involved in cell wall biosynthesis
MFLTQNVNCYRTLLNRDETAKFDLLHQFHVVPLGVACVLSKNRLGRHLVTSIMGTDSFAPRKSEGWVYYRANRPLAAWVMNSSDALTAPSKDTMIRAYVDGCNRKIEVIPHGVDLDLYSQGMLKRKASDLRARLGIGSEESMVLIACRLTRIKNLETLIRASPEILQRYPQVKFVTAGDGPEHDHLVSFATKLGVISSFRFVGRVQSTEMPIYHTAADLFLLTSLYEHFGLVLLEAMAACKPVIASKVGAIPEIVDDNITGFLFPPRDAKTLANLVLRLLDDPLLRIEMGANGRKKVEAHYNWDDITARYLRLYESLT